MAKATNGAEQTGADTTKKSAEQIAADNEAAAKAAADKETADKAAAATAAAKAAADKAAADKAAADKAAADKAAAKNSVSFKKEKSAAAGEVIAEYAGVKYRITRPLMIFPDNVQLTAQEVALDADRLAFLVERESSILEEIL